MKSLKQLLEELQLHLDDNLVLEMGNMQPRDTGLKPIVHIMHKGGAKHGPRVKVSNVPGAFHPKDNFTITVEHNPRIIGDCKLKPEHLDATLDWIKLNHDHLHKVWHDDTLSPNEVQYGFRRF